MTDTTEKRFILPAAVRDGMLNYLMTRPCGEVFNGVLALQALAALEDDKPEPVAEA